MRYFMLNNVDSRTHGLIMSINRSVLPALDPVLIKLPRRSGAYIPQKHSRDIAPAEFSVRLAILGDNPADFRSRVRSLAQWIFNVNEDGAAQPLWFSDEPARLYYVWITGSTPLEEVMATGEIEINFVAPDPFASNTALSTALFTDSGADRIITITNNGTADTFPDFRIVPTNNTTGFRLDDGEGNIILLNNVTIPAWQTFIINNRTADIYYETSGASLMQYLAIESRFFKLKAGKTYNMRITVTTGTVSARINFTQKYL